VALSFVATTTTTTTKSVFGGVASLFNCITPRSGFGRRLATTLCCFLQAPRVHGNPSSVRTSPLPSIRRRGGGWRAGGGTTLMCVAAVLFTTHSVPSFAPSLFFFFSPVTRDARCAPRALVFLASPTPPPVPLVMCVVACRVVVCLCRLFVLLACVLACAWWGPFLSLLRQQQSASAGEGEFVVCGARGACVCVCYC